jgi:hypothetical protein
VDAQREGEKSTDLHIKRVITNFIMILFLQENPFSVEGLGLSLALYIPRAWWR